MLEHFLFNYTTVVLPIGPSLAGEYLQLANAPTARSSSAFQVISDKAYVFGGTYSVAYNNTMAAYDLIAGTWENITAINPPVPQFGMAHCTFNNKLYVFGGNSASGIFATSSVYDPVTNTWSAIASMPSPRYWHTAVTINNKIYIFGGHYAAQLNSLLEYDPIANTYRDIPNSQSPCHGHTAVAINGIMYIIGGVNGSGVFDRVLAYNPSSNTWSNKTKSPFLNTYMPSTVVGGKAYVFGGSQNNTVMYNTLHEFDPARNTWRALPSGATGRALSAMVTYEDKAYLLGGWPGSGGLADLWKIS